MKQMSVLFFTNHVKQKFIQLIYTASQKQRKKIGKYIKASSPKYRYWLSLNTLIVSMKI